MLHQQLGSSVRGRRDGDRARRRLLRRGLSLIGLWALGRGGVVAAAESAALASRRQDTHSLTTSEADARASIQWLSQLAVAKLPRTIDGDKDWDSTKKVWSGVKVRLDGFKLRTKRRHREVEHGRWVKYAVTLPDPKSPQAAQITIEKVAPLVDASTGTQRWRVNSSMVAPMQFTARVQRWNLGVRLFSMTITGDLRIRMGSTIDVEFLADYSEVPPALVMGPQVIQAQLEMQHFEVNRVSHIGGDVAEQWGELIEEILVDRLVRKQNDRLVGKLNQTIEKEREDLRLSMADWLSRWQTPPNQSVRN